MGLFSRPLTGAERAEIEVELDRMKVERLREYAGFRQCVKDSNVVGAEAFGLSIFNCDWAIATLETLLKDSNRELRERWRGAMREGDRRTALEALKS